MGRLSFVCTTCSEHFTRRYSARRHNHNLHNGAAEIVILIDYIAGRSSGQYSPTLNPSWYKRRNIGSRTVADTVGETFQPQYIPQQRHRALSQYPASPMYPPRLIMNDPSYRTSSQDIVKIQELKLLMNKHPQCHPNPDGIIRLAAYNSMNHDNTVLDGMLERLRKIDLNKGCNEPRFRNDYPK
jgi:hypothetical protein